ncbi:hypothetical protein [Pectobacterium sp. 21LCBS03]|uniref:hypothetical protein n=1 Tax=Pectobacterium sp. 21LCBS03 TaxID=2935858 RepID=UPI00201035A4|nr:hypothetical protein [Pectobacterium sp. 21LCBS03]UPY96559.1 hypothetical protein MYB54_07645 [Pectobacterium sp. 21LCBS03]
MKSDNNIPKKQSVYKGMWYLITSTERFVSIAAENSMAFELEKEEYQRKLEQGNYSLDPKNHIHSHTQRLKELRTLLLKTTVYIFSIIILIAGIGFYTGALNIASHLSWKNSASALGIILISWATLFQLGWGNGSWSGTCLDELVRHSLFRHFFSIGVFFSLLHFVFPE